MTLSSERRTENLEALAALTPMQQGILFYSLTAQQNDPYFIQLVFSVQGALNTERLQQAWQVVVDRHQLLRTEFRWEEAATPVQVVFKTRPAVVALEDWQMLSLAEQRQRLASCLAEQRRAGYGFRRASECKLQLFQTGAESHWLVWSYHHIALDGWSMGVVLADVLNTYRELATLGASAVRAAYPYTAYVDWLQKQDKSEAASYWRRLLSGLDGPTPLPRCASGQGVGYAEHALRLTEAESEWLRERARRLGVTLPTLVQAGWALMLGRYADQSEVVIGVTVAGRSAALPGIDTTVGLFINTLPSRVRLHAPATVGAWLQAIQEQNLESRQYEHAPLTEIRRAAALPGNENLFESVVVFENFPLDEVLARQPSGLAVRALPLDQLSEDGVRTTGRNNYALTLNVMPSAQLTFTLAYRRDWFTDQKIVQLGAQLRHILFALSERADRRLGELGLRELVEAGPRDALHADALDSDLPSSVLEAFRACVQRAPGAVAVQVEASSWTYGELDALADRVASHLHDRGIGCEQRVALCAERSVEFIAALLGVWKVGAAYVPLDTKLPASRLVELVRECDARVVLATQAAAQVAMRSGAVPVVIEELLRAPQPAPVPAGEAHSEQAAYVIFTSGSTGRPKGVVVSHGALARYVNGLVQRLGLARSASMGMVSTVGADLGHTVLFGALSTGACLHLLGDDRAFDPDAFASYLAAHPIEVLKIVPSHLRALLQAARPACVLPTKLLVLGGEASDWALIERVRGLRPDCRVVNHYGPTEATVGASLHEVAAPVDVATVPIGRALPGAALEVLDRDLNRVPAGVAGELYIGGERLARGYDRAASASAERFVPNPYGTEGARMYRTGDRVRRLPSGALEFLGRIDRQIKLRGYRIELGEIEARLRQHELVRDAAVVVRPGAAGSDQLVAFVVIRAGASDVADKLRAYLGRIFPDYMVPSRIALVDGIPLTDNGKVDFKALPSDEPAPRGATVSPADDVQQKLLDVWTEVLRVPEIGVTDNFFELGGDSILSLQVVARARRRGLRVTPQQIFERPTVLGLAQVATTHAEPQRARTEGDASNAQAVIPLLPSQARFFTTAPPEPNRYNQALMLRTTERLERALLERALLLLVAHHDALRLRFSPGSDGKWRQTEAPGAQGAALVWARSLDHETEVARLTDEAQASLDLQRGPVLRAVLIDVSTKPQRLLLVIHHLVVDGVSWRVLLEDLQTIYRALRDGVAPLLPEKTSSLRAWAAKVSEYAQSTELADQLPYWSQSLADSAGHELPRDHPSGRNIMECARSSTLSLSRDETSRLLRQAPEAYGAQVQELMLTALARTLCAWTDRSSALLELEGHGREQLVGEMDLSRTVGWFTSMFPVRLTPVLGGRETIAAAIRAVKEQLSNVPRRGIDFGILRYLAPEQARSRLKGLPMPRVTFNYLGQFDQSFEGSSLFEPARESSGRTQSMQAPLGNWLVIVGQVYDGKLTMRCDYSRELYESTTIERLMETYRGELAELIALAARSMQP